jgi:hypothetical protein
MGRRLVLFAVVASLLTGCSSIIKPASAPFAGTWQLDPKSIKAPDPKLDASAAQALGSMVIKFKEDKTFVMSSKTGDKSGTFEVDGSKVTMKLSNPKSDDEKQPIIGKLADEGKTMNVTGGGTPFTMKFVKL